MHTTGMWTTTQSLPLHMAGVKATPMSPAGREMSAPTAPSSLSDRPNGSSEPAPTSMAPGTAGPRLSTVGRRSGQERKRT